MTPGGLIFVFFFFVLAAVGAIGYIFVLRPSRSAAGSEATAPPPIGLIQPSLPKAQAAVIDMFRLMGEAVPGAKNQAGALRQQLVAAGYRWPSAVSIFLGIKFASALLLGMTGLWAAATFSEGGFSSSFLPAVCGLGFGYLLPDRVLDRMAKGRVDRLRRGLPAALDLMVLAIEAGQAGTGRHHSGYQPRPAQRASGSGV